MRFPTWRIDKWVALALIAGLVWPSYLNYLAQLDSDYSNDSQRSIRTVGIKNLIIRSELAIQNGNLSKAINLSSKAVYRAPVDAMAVRTLGTSLMLAGELDKADVLLRIAGGYGWYDVPTQLIWAEVALQSGEFEVAAQRLDAALRVTQSREFRIVQAMRNLEFAPKTQGLFLNRIKSADDWREAYLTNFENMTPEEMTTRVEVIRKLHQGGILFDLKFFNRVEAVLVYLKQPGLARRVWDMHPIAGSRNTTLTDVDFLGYSARDEKGPFEWTFFGSSGVWMRNGIAPPPISRKALRITANAPFGVTFAQQVLDVEPDEYVISIDVVGAKTNSPISAAISCQPSGRTVRSIFLRNATPKTFLSISVPQDCGTSYLQLILNGLEAEAGADLWIGGVSIEDFKNSAISARSARSVDQSPPALQGP